jgi:O-antigen chain-terminating methyltransferase
MTRLTVDRLEEIVAERIAARSGPRRGEAAPSPEEAGEAVPGLAEWRARTRRLLSEVGEHRDCRRPFPPASHRRVLGPFVNFAKRAVRRLLRPVIHDALARQSLFDEAAYRLLEEQQHRIEYLERTFLERVSRREHDLEIALQDLMDDVRGAVRGAGGAESARGALAGVVARGEAADYARFHASASSFDLARDLFRRYVPYFEGRRRVVDLGCGRGPFLEVAREAGIPAYGVDLNPDLVAGTRERGFEVMEGDAIGHLEGLEPGDVDGIFCAHLVEHLETPDLIRFLRRAFRALPDDGILVFESPNTESLGVMAQGYYRDLTHVAPRHPETYRFLAEACGFTDTRVEKNLPFGPEWRLSPVPEGAGADPELARTLDENFRRVNELLFGEWNFAVVAYRRGGASGREDAGDRS